MLHAFEVHKEARNKCCLSRVTNAVSRVSCPTRARALSLSLILSHSLSLAFSSDGVPDLHLQHGAERSKCVGMCAHARRRDCTSTMRNTRHTRSTQKHTRGPSVICTPPRKWWRVCALKPWPAPVTKLPCLICACPLCQ